MAVAPSSKCHLSPYYPGSVLYLFTIQGELGAGAAGIVYKAAHKTTGEEVGKYIYPG